MAKRDSYVLAMDQGTTSSRSILFNGSGEVVSIAQQEFQQYFPSAGEVEHDPDEIWSSQYRTSLDLIKNAGLTPENIVAIGITNQRETTILWDRATGKPFYPAIVWQDRRTAEFCNRIREEHGFLVRNKTGLIPDSYFSASKVKWILDNVPGLRTKAKEGSVCFGTVDSWLLWKLTGRHCTDVSNASRTMLFDIHNLRWDDELLELFDVPETVLPEVVESSGEIARVEVDGPLKGIPVSGIAGDQQAALFGQTCFDAGDAKNTYGTGCFTLMNTGDKPVVSEHRLLTTIAWQIGGKTTYALEGSVFVGGAVIQWLRDGLNLFEDSSDVEAMANSVEDNGGVFFVPAFAGLGTPYWNQNARGTIIGITRGTKKGHIALAAQESIAFQTFELLDSVQKDAGQRLSDLRVDGGATANRSLLQFQSDILGIPVILPKTTETTALGAAYLAGLAVGYWSDRQELVENHKIASTFKPQRNDNEVDEFIARWREAVKRSLDWA